MDMIEQLQPNNQILNLNTRYLGDSIASALPDHKYICVHSGMGTGKTTAIKKALSSLKPNECALIQAPRSKLLRSMATELGFSYYEDVKNESDKKKKREMVKRLCVTPQSAPALLSEFSDIEYKLVVIDESETQASMLVSSATNNKLKALKALKATAKKASNVVLMDAHIGAKTDTLMSILSTGEPVLTISNSFKTWDKINATILKGSSYRNRRLAIDALQFDDIKNGSKLAICSSSKAYCKQRAQALSVLFPHLSVLLITADDSKHTQEVLNNPDSIGKYDVVIFSPSVSVGVSFAIQNHINKVYGVFPNTIHTGDTDDALQAMARIRKPKDNKWVICLDDSKSLFSLAPKCPNDIATAIGQRMYRIDNKLKVDQDDMEAELIKLFSICDYERVNSKNNYTALFLSRLDSMGISVSELDISTLQQNQESNDLTQALKEESKLLEVKHKTTAERITRKEAQAIIIKQKHNKASVTEQEAHSLLRYKAEKDLMINFDDYSEDECAELIEQLDNGIVSKCINREIALAPKSFTKKYLSAKRLGVGEHQAFKADVLSNSYNYQIKKKLFSYAKEYFSGKEYTHKSLRYSPLVQFVRRHEKEITALRVVTVPTNYKTKPALLLNNLLEACGYSHTSSKNKDKKYTYRAISIKHIDDLHSKRLEQLKDWVTTTDKLIEAYTDNERIDSSLITTASLDNDIEALKNNDLLKGLDIDQVSQDHFYYHLAKQQPSNRQLVADEYIKIATAKNDKLSPYSPQAKANLYLLSI